MDHQDREYLEDLYFLEYHQALLDLVDLQVQLGLVGLLHLVCQQLNLQGHQCLVDLHFLQDLEDLLDL
ncbi:MAG: hypothetical protein EBY29_14205 [Planctomycetes bacterium]|nr:hypothetical protein [Planctomycetota bacterium]